MTRISIFFLSAVLMLAVAVRDASVLAAFSSAGFSLAGIMTALALDPRGRS